MAISMKSARVNANLTVNQACKLIGISKGTLLKYENFKTIPSIKTARKMAEVYNMSTDDIIFYEEKVC